MEHEHMSGDDRRAVELLRAPVTLGTLPDGSYRIEQAGIVGVGSTPQEAAADCAGKLLIEFTRPPLR